MRNAFVLPALLVFLASAPGAAAEEEPPPTPPKTQLTLEDLHGGPSFTKPIPDWSWRPGHAELVRRGNRTRPAQPPTPVLLAMDPETGTERELLDLGAMHTLVPGKGVRMRGIGRAGPPSFKWSADGKALCLVVKGDLVWVDLEAGTRRRLTETDAALSDLNIAPDGAHVSFSRENELWVVSTKEGAPRRLTTGGSKTLLNATLDWLYPEELDFRTAAWWSPDSKSIAYLQMDQSDVPVYRVPGLLPLRSEGREMFYPKAGDPNPKVRLGVVPPTGGKTVWVPLGDPAPEYIARVAWLGTGNAQDPCMLLVVTLDRAQRHLKLFGALVRDEACLVELLHEEKDAAWIDVPSEIVRQGRFLWHRQDETARFYVGQPKLPSLTPTPGGMQMYPLTPADFEATDVHAFGAPASLSLITGRRRGDINDTVLSHRITTDASTGWSGGELRIGPPADLHVDKTQSIRVDPDASGTYALLTTSSATVPPRKTLVRVHDGEVLREIGNASTPRLEALDLSVPEYGTLPIEGLGDIHWRLWKPADLDETRSYGLIVHVYGGPGSRMINNRWGRGPLLATLLNQRGFLVLEVDGRGTRGQGRDFMKCVQGRLGKLELEDQVRAVEEITKRPYVDAKRVGIWGWSYGGTMVCNALTRRSDVFSAGVAVASVTDWRLYDTIYTERYMGTPESNAKGYDETCCIPEAKNMSGKLLLLHGLGDDNVHAQNTIRLIEAFLEAKNLNYDAMLYPRRGHGIGGASLDVFTRLLRHFETHLGVPAQK
jgi:dipeptidyl-peptidase-4